MALEIPAHRWVTLIIDYLIVAGDVVGNEIVEIENSKKLTHRKGSVKVYKCGIMNGLVIIEGPLLCKGRD